MESPVLKLTTHSNWMEHAKSVILLTIMGSWNYPILRPL